MKTAETVALLPVACGVPGGMLRRKMNAYGSPGGGFPNGSRRYVPIRRGLCGVLKDTEPGEPFCRCGAGDRLPPEKGNVVRFGRCVPPARRSVLPDRCGREPADAPFHGTSACVGAGYGQRPPFGNGKRDTAPSSAERAGNRCPVENTGCETRYFRKTIKI